MFCLLGLVVFSIAYSAPNMSRKILGGNDISYGVYIYHMPIINVLIFIGAIGHIAYVVLATVLILSAALLSWQMVERPALAMKRHAFFSVT